MPFFSTSDASETAVDSRLCDVGDKKGPAVSSSCVSTSQNNVSGIITGIDPPHKASIHPVSLSLPECCSRVHAFRVAASGRRSARRPDLLSLKRACARSRSQGRRYGCTPVAIFNTNRSHAQCTVSANQVYEV